jgi:hypothetical protein
MNSFTELKSLLTEEEKAAIRECLTYTIYCIINLGMTLEDTVDHNFSICGFLLSKSPSLLEFERCYYETLADLRDAVSAGDALEDFINTYMELTK